jgi:CheY-like chemotaxis protein
VATILCVDDRTYALATRVAWLRAHGHVVILAGSIEVALDSLLTGPIQAALLDCHMPGACPFTALLKRIRPDLPIIMLASYCSGPCHEASVVTACLGKGDPPAILLRTLRKLIGGEIPGQIAA